ncbi:MAG: MBL fold metallo-hydrolase [Clostridium sp.]|uniref:MBL fold metallo-hydrolase n=1 Tax=Clostridium sp. TaxID=1506 RepID=UPI003EE7167D
MKIAENIYMLNISATLGDRTMLLHPVVIKTDSTNILIDTGFPNQLSMFEDALKEIDLTIDNLDIILLTHHDIDHVGNAKAIIKKSKNKNLKILASKDEVPFIDGTKTPHKLAKLEANLKHLDKDMMERYHMFKKGFAHTKVRVDSILTDKEVLPYAGGIEVVETPGHTIGHTCFYFKESKLLIAGDLFFIEDENLALGNETMNFDNSLIKTSLEKLSTYDIEMIVCYHGGLYTHDVNESIHKLFKSR